MQHLQKTRGGGVLPTSESLARSRRQKLVFYSSTFFSNSCALFCPFLRSPKTQLVSFQAIPHSFPKTRGCGEGGEAVFLTKNFNRMHSLTALSNDGLLQFWNVVVSCRVS